MEFWLTVFAAIAVLLLIPPLRAFFKRLRMLQKIKKCCRKNGYTLRRSGSPFALNGSERTTFQIEKGNKVFLVKLMGSLHKLETIYLNTGGTYFVQRIIPLGAGRGGSITHTKTGRTHPFPEVDWLNGEQEDFGKRYIPIILFCPAPMEIRVIRGQQEESLISDGTVGGGYIGKLKKRPLNKDRDYGSWSSGGYSCLKGSSMFHSGDTFGGAYLYGTRDFLRILENDGNNID